MPENLYRLRIPIYLPDRGALRNIEAVIGQASQKQGVDALKRDREDFALISGETTEGFATVTIDKLRWKTATRLDKLYSIFDMTPRLTRLIQVQAGISSFTTDGPWKNYTAYLIERMWTLNTDFIIKDGNIIQGSRTKSKRTINARMAEVYPILDKILQIAREITDT